MNCNTTRELALAKIARAAARGGEAARWAFWQANSDVGVCGGMRWGNN